MDKQKLIRILVNASEIEEGYTPVITRFFLDDFDWNGADQDKVESVKKILNVIQSQTQQHERILNELIKKVQESADDEF